MTFLWPAMLVSLLLIPALIGAYISVGRRRQRLLASYSSLGLPVSAAGRAGGGRRKVPPAIFLLALALLFVSLARPQAVVSLPRLEGTVMLAFDVSGSMGADDMKPNRIEVAKAAARDFIARQPTTVQIGVVSFSEAGFATQAPTSDQAAVLASINRLSLERGTSLGVGIEAALNALTAESQPAQLTLSTREPTPEPTPEPVAPGTYTSSVIVLLTDGENTQAPDPLEAAQLAADRGVRIYTVGVGSPEGVTLNIEGFSVRSRLDEAMLQQIAQLTGGTYQHAANETELRRIYDTLNPKLVVKPEATELTALFVAAAVLLLLIGASLSLLWFSRLT